MARLEDLTRDASVKGILPGSPVTVVDVKWLGTVAVELTYKDAAGRLGNELLYRDREPALEIVTRSRPWNFDGDGGLFRLVSEARRIRLAYLFDPLLAVHTSLIEPLPHQITAVYESMLSRQPLRFLLADDPGAGKTIMAGLLIKELIIRGDVHRCLICVPGNLVEQWQDELAGKFHLPFEILTRERFETARTGNPFAEMNLIICRLDQLSRNDDIQDKLRITDWDLIICDEAHKMSATFFGGELKTTKRYRLGRLLGTITRHFLLMTATPHNGKEEDFQLFMALLDGDRFEGRFRDGVHVVDTSDLMRRLVKEQLLKFDGTPLFPERRAYTVTYRLSDREAALYEAVTAYVREEMNRADRLAAEGEGARRTSVGFALTILQRRLASSPAAIYQSLKRRRERLERRLREEKLLQRGREARLTISDTLDEEALADLEDAPAEEREETEEILVDQATAARTIAELEIEIAGLKQLEETAQRVYLSGADKKWEELSSLLQDEARMFDAHGHRRKLVIFTEYRDTLHYLAEKISNLLGRKEAVATISGGMSREERRKVQEAFIHQKEVQILVATDAAGEGINLQRAHLMVNYDLPWNPNRLEQRFGRIHRIGQTEVCHLWNLVAAETREGEVYHRLLEKLAEEREALGGRVFDVLGRVFDDYPLRDLLMEAIRYGENPEVRARLYQVVDRALDREHLTRLLEERALAAGSMDATRVQRIRADMERAAARRLQPHFIRSFFLEAFALLGGTIRQREPGRYEITHVPASIRQRDRLIGTGSPVLSCYERVCFEKERINMPGFPPAAFICPGHPLLDATIDLIIERYRELLKKGAVLIDPGDNGGRTRVLFYLEHAIQDGRSDQAGNRRVVSRQMQFVEMDETGRVRSAGYAPYLDYRPAKEDELALLRPALDAPWLHGELEQSIITHAVEHIVPRHFEETRRRREELVDKVAAAVKDRLTKEINYWDHRAEDLKAQESAGKINARINSVKARQRADELAARLQKRLTELAQERRLSPLPPVVTGGALVVPAGLPARLRGEETAEPDLFARETARVERLAMEAVLVRERSLGREPRDVSADKCGYDIESRDPARGLLYFIEVKGRIKGAKTVTVTRNEILTALNKPEQFILALVVADGDQVERTAYLNKPFQKEPDFGVTSVNYDLDELLARGV
ncbi:helicase-related protein [Desulfotomaculum copahuensis]|uniref:RNA helicase n=1 Tax=Desulfotomaculum copahuensis TaxID=1838280 RepID=A0A1B7LEL1_9FIRM|nr:helicase-related protein [Desulfotomaculum copahuensis]OAT81708.1 RNA helicase [Desulfotomaculum copahuensis]